MKDAIEVVVLFQWQNQAVAHDVMKLLGQGSGPRAKSQPAAIASELKARAAYLRSRPMAHDEGLEQLEREILVELDMLEIRARMLEVERQLGKAGPAYRGDLAQLEDLAFAARRRFVALVDACNEPWPMRAKPQDPNRRAEELAAIERFVQAKRAAEGPLPATGADGLPVTGTDGK